MNHPKQPLFFDIECDGLRETVSKIWCITVNDQHFGPDNIENGVKLLHNNWICGHNCINYDVPVIQKFYPWFKPEKIDDTFILSSLFEPDRYGHSLADWGQQFGIPKPEHEDWSKYSDAMRHRNIEDVRITKAVWEHLCKERYSGWDWEEAIRLEYRIATLHAKQEANGVGFDVQAALVLHDRITKEVEQIDLLINATIPKRILQVGATITKPYKINGELNERVKAWILEDHSQELPTKVLT